MVDYFYVSHATVGHNLEIDISVFIMGKVNFDP